jgi:hypothetical protein
MKVRTAISRNIPVLDLDESAIPTARLDEDIPSSFCLLSEFTFMSGRGHEAYDGDLTLYAES